MCGLTGLLFVNLIAQTPNPAAVDGTVINEITGQPVKKARVSLNLKATSTVTTDAAGHFRFDHVEPGMYTITAECSGYKINGLLEKVEAEQQIREIAIRLTPLATASGRVLDEDGEPMRFVQVVAVHYAYLPGGKQLDQIGNALTDDLGHFQMMDLPPGKYFFEAEPTNRQPLPPNTISTIPEQTYPSTFYPNGSTISQAAPVELKPGIEMGNVEFHIKPQPSFHIRGRVAVSEAGFAPNQIHLRLARPGIRWGSHAETSAPVLADGTFDFSNVVNGEYVLLALQLENGNTKFARRSIAVFDKNAEDIVLAPAPGSSIQGLVAIEGCDASQLPANSFVSLEGVGDFRFGARPFPVTKDTFHIQGMMPDLYQVSIPRTQPGALVPGTYLKAIQLNGRDLPDAKLDLTNAVAGDLRIVMGRDPGVIRGTVHTASGGPAAYVTVTAAPPDERVNFPGLLQSIETDQNGTFQFAAASPGDYTIIAWDVTPNSKEILNPEFAKLFETKAVKVSLQPNGNESVQLVAIPRADIEAATAKLP
jgi:hypothetical protein